MELSTYNPQKGRRETLEVEFTPENTTWFEYSRRRTVSTITDFKGGILIKMNDYSCPVWLYDISRADINYSKKKAKELMQQAIT
jgi:hypothetical protein